MAPARQQLDRAARTLRPTTRPVVGYDEGPVASGSGGTNNKLDAPSGAILVAAGEVQELTSRVESLGVDVRATCDRLLGLEDEPDGLTANGPDINGAAQLGALAASLRRLEKEVDTLAGQVARLRAL